MRRNLALLGLLPLLIAAAPQGQRHLKLRVAVAPMQLKDQNLFDQFQIPVEFRLALDEKLSKRLLDTGKFVVLERAALEEILTEKEIKEETSGQSQKRKIIPAQALVQPKLTNFELNNKGAGGGINVGGIGRIGGSVSEAKGTINVRIIDVDSSELIASEDASGTAQAKGFSFSGNNKVAWADFGAFEKTPLGKAMDTAITKAVEQIVKQLAKQPWSARIADVDGKELTISAGEDSGVQAGDEFVLYKKGKEIRDPDSGEILGVRMSKSGRVRIKEVDKKFSVAEMIEGDTVVAGDVIKEK
ncbi:hypothetical protein EON81_09290 [bacterium]|nr:MAG: hypothetical protein EON81_09290 [bacterium]